MKRNVKTIAAVLITSLLVITFLSGCGSSNSSGGQESKELNVFNWTEYIPDITIQKFEEEYGVKVNYSMFSSNEEMLAKVAAGGGVYDLTMASDYIVPSMIERDMIEPIDLSNIPNFEYLIDDYIDQDFDPGNKYSVPFMGNTLSLGVNPDAIGLDPSKITSYTDLWSPELENQLVVLDDQRMIIGMILKSLGYSANSTDPKELEEAKEKMIELLPNIKAFDSDSPKQMMVNGEAAGGLVWGPEIALAQREGANFETIIPEEGLLITMDNWVIPKDAKNKELAEKFINFILEPEISAEIAQHQPYINPNKEARKLIDEDILNNIAIYPPEEEVERLEYIEDIGEAIQLYDRVWSEAKGSQ
ncbi:PotD/PotF family extracellular solute-binding protein [Siminovitchia sediminis]|uniref:PotD/PotF family extracellular solute-binding protein n=1 Tax=Siminovitchia sediminis TaxID=1274353 RepID=A0ABW4KEQ0_9BACI